MEQRAKNNLSLSERFTHARVTDPENQWKQGNDVINGTWIFGSMRDKKNFF